MNHSAYWERYKQLIPRQLQNLEEIRSSHLDKYVTMQAKEHQQTIKLLDQYMWYLKQLLMDRSEKTFCLLYQHIKIQFLDDDFMEEYYLTFPHEAKPEAGEISILSPVGRQLLLAPLESTFMLATPNDTIPIKIIDIVCDIKQLEKLSS